MKTSSSTFGIYILIFNLYTPFRMLTKSYIKIQKELPSHLFSNPVFFNNLSKEEKFRKATILASWISTVNKNPTHIKRAELFLSLSIFR